MRHRRNTSSNVLAIGVAEEPGPPTIDCGRVAEVVEQCRRGPRRLPLQFSISQATTVSASWRDGPPQFESPATSAAHVAVDSIDSSDHHEVSVEAPTWRVSEEQAIGTAGRNMCQSPGLERRRQKR